MSLRFVGPKRQRKDYWQRKPLPKGICGKVVDQKKGENSFALSCLNDGSCPLKNKIIMAFLVLKIHYTVRLLERYLCSFRSMANGIGGVPQLVEYEIIEMLSAMVCGGLLTMLGVLERLVADFVSGIYSCKTFGVCFIYCGVYFFLVKIYILEDKN